MSKWSGLLAACCGLQPAWQTEARSGRCPGRAGSGLDRRCGWVLAVASIERGLVGFSGSCPTPCRHSTTRRSKQFACRTGGPFRFHLPLTGPRFATFGESRHFLLNFGHKKVPIETLAKSKSGLKFVIVPPEPSSMLTHSGSGCESARAHDRCASRMIAIAVPQHAIIR
ncbi:hypothetical protein BQ8794_240180 [Mesorhizobium prunaredense]|uniref:Uncharacterized protein n=1 Tax=Mesorhizobium prunaredense TaxID=1631249 RepID=A0A1R3V7V2_9HYPH|nr:hypothetical protein BQ8794_240180 [Mesorhizobium prunaredense]